MTHKNSEYKLPASRRLRILTNGIGTLLLAATLLFSVACGSDNPENREQNNGGGNDRYVTGAFRLEPAQSCDDVKWQVEDAIAEDIFLTLYRDEFVGGNNNAGNNSTGNNGSPNNVSSPDNGNDGSGDGPGDYTETNVQESGVDEPDIVKTDGEYIYTIHNNQIVILKSWPPEDTEVVARYSMTSQNQPTSLFLNDDHLIVFSDIYQSTRSIPRNNMPSNNGYGANSNSGSFDESDPSVEFSGTRITVLDVSNRLSPTLHSEVDIEGAYVNGRMIGDKVYLVTNSRLRTGINTWDILSDVRDEMPAIDVNASDEARLERLEQARPMIRNKVRSAYEDFDVASVFPRKRLAEEGNNDSATMATLYDCTDIYLPAQLAKLGFLNISQIDLGSDSAVESTGLLAEGWLVYASQDNLYVAMSSRSWWWDWGPQSNESHIHQFNLPTTQSRPNYMASGKVDGWILNQFSMSEYDGHLRVAVTDNQWAWDEETGERIAEGGNHLIIVKDIDGTLEETGSVRNLAPDERIYSARMIGEKGYIVTFRETDPLYTLDLSNPNDPKLMGELKIDGFSSYIHPLGDEHLLTIGRDGDAQGNLTGVHLQIFDVSDMTDPTRAFHHTISIDSWSSDSEAMWNHHAFTYHAEKQVLAVPMIIYDEEEPFSGLMLFNANDTDGFSEIGRVDHGDLVAQNWCRLYQNEEDCTPDSHWNRLSQMRRSIFMDDYVYSLSSVGLKVNDLYTPENEHAAVLLQE